MKLPLLSSVLGLSQSALNQHPLAFPSIPTPNVTIVPSEPATGPITAQFISASHSLDAPKLSAVNETAVDWWYFDVVAEDGGAHICVTFFTASNTSFPILGPVEGVDTVYIWASFPNETLYTNVLTASEAVITSYDEGASGIWAGTGTSFHGTPDLSRYVLVIDSPEAGIYGTILMHSIAPAHYPCGPLGPGEDMHVVPNIGWANAIPDSDARVNVNILGTRLSFTGSGYHDKNWGDKPLFTSFTSWYWGHANFGPYSLVWFDVLDLEGKEHVSGYIAKDNKILTTQCSGVQARPYGKNADYPPHASNGPPTGWTVSVDLGEEGVLEADVAVKLELIGVNIYRRFISTVSGGFSGGEQWNGTGINEQFVLLP